MPLAEPRLAADIETVVDAGITGAVFADNGLLAWALGDGSVQLIGPDEDIRSVQAHDGAALCLALDIDGRTFVSGGDDGKLVRTSPDGSLAGLMHPFGRAVS